MLDLTFRACFFCFLGGLSDLGWLFSRVVEIMLHYYLCLLAPPKSNLRWFVYTHSSCYLYNSKCTYVLISFSSNCRNWINQHNPESQSNNGLEAKLNTITLWCWMLRHLSGNTKPRRITLWFSCGKQKRQQIPIPYHPCDWVYLPTFSWFF